MSRMPLRRLVALLVVASLVLAPLGWVAWSLQAAAVLDETLTSQEAFLVQKVDRLQVVVQSRDIFERVDNMDCRDLAQAPERRLGSVSKRNGMWIGSVQASVAAARAVEKTVMLADELLQRVAGIRPVAWYE